MLRACLSRFDKKYVLDDMMNIDTEYVLLFFSSLLLFWNIILSCSYVSAYFDSSYTHLSLNGTQNILQGKSEKGEGECVCIVRA